MSVGSLTERQARILFTIAEAFIDTGEPISSGAVVGMSGLKISSATVRNEMSELESMGLIEKPHTSAGRVPTAYAMRLYVNALREGTMHSPLSEQALRARLHIDRRSSIEQMTRASGELLSQVARLTSIVSLPSLDAARLRDIHLTARSERRVLVLLVTDDGRVYHREVALDRPVEPGELVRWQNYLSELVIGLDLRQVRARVSEELERLERDALAMREALELGRAALEAARTDVIVEGKLRFFEHAEFSGNVGRLGELMGLLEEKERVLDLLDGIVTGHSPDALVLIGPEIGWDDGDDLGIVICAYARGGATGALGLIGPTRLDYARVIPLVEQTARALSDRGDSGS